MKSTFIYVAHVSYVVRVKVSTSDRVALFPRVSGTALTITKYGPAVSSIHRRIHVGGPVTSHRSV